MKRTGPEDRIAVVLVLARRALATLDLTSNNAVLSRKLGALTLAASILFSATFNASSVLSALRCASAQRFSLYLLFASAISISFFKPTISVVSLSIFPFNLSVSSRDSAHEMRYPT